MGRISKSRTVQADYARSLIGLEMAFDGIPDHAAQLVHRLGLGDNCVAQRLGNIPPVWVLFDREDNLRMPHNPPPLRITCPNEEPRT